MFLFTSLKHFIFIATFGWGNSDTYLLHVEKTKHNRVRDLLRWPIYWQSRDNNPVLPKLRILSSVEHSLVHWCMFGFCQNASLYQHILCRFGGSCCWNGNKGEDDIEWWEVIHFELICCSLKEEYIRTQPKPKVKLKIMRTFSAERAPILFLPPFLYFFIILSPSFACKREAKGAVVDVYTFIIKTGVCNIPKIRMKLYLQSSFLLLVCACACVCVFVCEWGPKARRKVVSGVRCSHFSPLVKPNCDFSTENSGTLWRLLSPSLLCLKTS